MLTIVELNLDVYCTSFSTFLNFLNFSYKILEKQLPWEAFGCIHANTTQNSEGAFTLGIQSRKSMLCPNNCIRLQRSTKRRENGHTAAGSHSSLAVSGRWTRIPWRWLQGWVRKKLRTHKVLCMSS